MILCSIIQQVNAGVSCAGMKTFFFMFLIIPLVHFCIAAAVGKPGFRGISTFLDSFLKFLSSVNYLQVHPVRFGTR